MSTAPLVLAGEFPPASEAQWRCAVDKVLAGRDTDLSRDDLDRRFARQLTTSTYDGITVDPLYTAEVLGGDPPPSGPPGFWPYVRGASVLGGALNGWDVRPVLRLGDGPRSGSASARDHLEAGATSLLLRMGERERDPTPDVDVDLLDGALDGVYLDLVSVALDTSLGTSAPAALVELWRRRGVDPEMARGVLGLDPIGAAASVGRPVDPEEISDAAALALASAEGWPGVRSWVVDATRYHEAGASDVDEIACGTATGVAYLRLLVDAGLSVGQALGQLEFRFSATADQFATIAKLRASRRLWARVAQVLGVSAAGGQRQHAFTSRAMLSRYEPWVNLLRNTTACFAAGAGGADAVTVEDHDLAVDPTSETDLGVRMARNTQLLLIEESQVARVLDPGGGSWYLEWFTDRMAEQAWARFQEIESTGGMAEALASGTVQARIEETWAARMDRLARRADTLVGVNDFPNLDDPMPPPAGRDPRASEGERGLPRRRYAESFERLRERTDAHERATGRRPGVLLVCIGTAAAYTARSTYAKAFFETAGLPAALHAVGEADPIAGVAQALADTGAALVCLCSSDPVYGETAGRVLGGFGALAANIERTYVATRPGALGDGLLSAGADELIYTGCNVLEALTRALDSLGLR